MPFIKRNLLRGTQGMSLIEVMIAMSVLSIISLTILIMNKNMNKSVKDTEKKSDIDMMSREIAQLIADKEICKATFVGISLPSNTSNNETILIPSIRRFNNQGVPIPFSRMRVTPVNPNSNQPIINGMMLRRISNVPGTPSQFELVVTFLKNPKAAVAAAGSASADNVMRNYVTRAFPVRLDDCRRRITSVSSSSGSNVPVACPAGEEPVSNKVYRFFSWGFSSNAMHHLRHCRDCTVKTTVTGCL
jgi:prepilin-type N-terminal cleavage/methylation domain-containing protein